MTLDEYLKNKKEKMINILISYNLNDAFVKDFIEYYDSSTELEKYCNICGYFLCKIRQEHKITLEEYQELMKHLWFNDVR